MKGDINTYRMVKVPCRLMHWVTLFGPFLGPNLPKNRHFVNFLENGSYDFFKTWNKDGGHQYLSNGDNPIVIDSFPQELKPKNWGDDVIIWAQFCRLVMVSTTYCYTSMKDEMVGISDVLIHKEVRYVCGVCGPR